MKYIKNEIIQALLKFFNSSVYVYTYLPANSFFRHDLNEVKRSTAL